MVAKIVPYIFVGLIQVFIILGLGHWIFGVPINGAISQILFGTLLFIAASLTLGLVISTIATTQLQAMQMTVFILLPSILLSGFMFLTRHASRSTVDFRSPARHSLYAHDSRHSVARSGSDGLMARYPLVARVYRIWIGRRVTKV